MCRKKLSLLSHKNLCNLRASHLDSNHDILSWCDCILSLKTHSLILLAHQRLLHTYVPLKVNWTLLSNESVRFNTSEGSASSEENFQISS